MYANEYEKHSDDDDDYQRLERLGNRYIYWYEYDSERERKRERKIEISYRHYRSRSRKHQKHRRSHRSKSKDKESRSRSKKHHRRSGRRGRKSKKSRSHRHYHRRCSSSSSEGSSYRSCRSHYRRSHRSDSSDRRSRSRHKKRYSYSRQSARYCDRYYHRRCSSNSSERSSYAKRYLANSDRHHSSNREQESHNRCDLSNKYSGYGTDKTKYEWDKMRDVLHGTHLQTPNPTLTQMFDTVSTQTVSISTQTVSISTQNAFTSNDYAEILKSLLDYETPISTQNAFTSNDYAEILKSLLDYETQGPSPNQTSDPSGMDNLASSYAEKDTFQLDVLPSTSFREQMLNESDTIMESCEFFNFDNFDLIEPEENTDGNSEGTAVTVLNNESVITHEDKEAYQLKRCSVKLEKLQEQEAQDNKQMPNDVAEAMVIGTTSKIKNNNPEWYSSAEKTNCIICKLRLKNWSALVRHYVNDHPNDEVYSSRVAPDVAELLRDAKAVHKSVPRKRKRCFKFEQFCYFCNTLQCFERKDWARHIARHTGYYQYQRSDNHIKSVLIEYKCKAERLTQPSQRQFDKQFQFLQNNKSNVMAYLCDLCNYVRFDKTSIRCHLNSQHDCNVDDNFKEVIFLRFPKEYGHNLNAGVSSRVSPGVGRYLRSVKYTPKCEIKLDKGRSHYKQFCYFCNESKSLAKYDWIKHIMAHTGYHEYQCVSCSKKFAKWSKKHMCDDNSYLKKLQHPRFDGENVIAYLCDLCDYVRFDKADIENHLRLEHEGSAMDDFEDVIFLSLTATNLVDKKIAEKTEAGTINLAEPGTTVDEDRKNCGSLDGYTEREVPEKVQILTTTNGNYDISSIAECIDENADDGLGTCSEK